MSNNLFAFRFNLDSIKKNINLFGKELNPNDMSLIEAIFIKGEKSDYILIEDYSIIEKHFPKSKIIEIKNANHWIHVSNPDMFLERIKQLI